MSGDYIDPDRTEYLRNKYVIPPSSLQQAVITAEAEQLAQAVLDTRAACEEYNEQHGLGWLTLDLPTQLRECIDRYSARLREAQSRDSLDRSSTSSSAGSLVAYYDDRNSYDEANGWPAHDPDNPHMQNVPLGHILCDPTTVHVLRGGTEPLFDARDGRGHYQHSPVPDETLPDWGHGYDFSTFFRTAERRHMIRFCDLRLPDGCATGIGGGSKRLAAIPLGRHIYMVSLCDDCLGLLEQTFADDHPRWRRRNPMAL